MAAPSSNASDAAALTFLFAEPPAPGTVMPVAPGVAWVRMPLPFALNHINLWLLEDGDGWAIVDTGFGVEATRTLWEQVFCTQLSGRQVTRVIVTHFHPDHIGNAGWLVDRWGVECRITEAEFLTAHLVHAGAGSLAPDAGREHFRRHGLEGDRLDAPAKRLNAFRLGVPTLPQRYLRLMDGEVLSIGGREWRVITVWGHAPEHATLYCAETRTLISGDQVLPRITTNVAVFAQQPEANPLELFLRSLARFAPLPADTLVLPSHGLPFVGLHARIAQLREHHRARLAELLAALELPRTAAEVIPILFRRELDAHQLSFAMGEAIAHLNYLVAAGQATRAGTGRLTFRRA